MGAGFGRPKRLTDGYIGGHTIRNLVPEKQTGDFLSVCWKLVIGREPQACMCGGWVLRPIHPTVACMRYAVQEEIQVLLWLACLECVMILVCVVYKPLSFLGMLHLLPGFHPAVRGEPRCSDGKSGQSEDMRSHMEF